MLQRLRTRASSPTVRGHALEHSAEAQTKIGLIDAALGAGSGRMQQRLRVRNACIWEDTECLIVVDREGQGLSWMTAVLL